MKILLVTSDKYPPFRPAAKAIFGEEFGRRGYQVDCVMQAESSKDGFGKLEFHNGTAYIARSYEGKNKIERLKKYWSDFANDIGSLWKLRNSDYDIIQVKDKYIIATVALWFARRRGKPFCYWIAYPHAEAEIYAAQQKIARYPLLYRARGWYRSLMLYRIIMPSADHIFVQSEQMRLDFSKKGIPQDKMTPVPSSLNLAEVPYIPIKDAISCKQNVLYVGTLLRERRLDFVIRAFSIVRSRCPEAILVIVGKGENPEDEAILYKEVSKLKLQDAVKFTGFVSPDIVWDYIRQANVCLSPYYDTFILNSTSPTKLIEYMAMAKPVVANDHPEQSFVVNNSNAGICTPWNEAEFGEAIVKLLQNPLLARNMGLKGRKWIEKNRTNRLMADLVVSDYQELK